MLTTLIQRGSYPFNQEIRKELKEFQDKNNLTEREVEEISQPILKAAEVEYQEKLRQRYTQEFKRVIDAGYPIDEVARSELKNFQQSLGLSDENVASVEQPIIAPKEAEYRQRLEAERLRQEQEKAKYENNRRQYEQELLKSLQQSLGLKGEHVVGIEQLVLRRYTYDDLSSEKGVDYTRLQDLLKAGQWQQADRETKSAMLKAVGGVLEGGLSFKSIKNFPYTDLLTIDRLWVKYSNGRFGFSVQKKSGKKLTGITELLLIA